MAFAGILHGVRSAWDSSKHPRGEDGKFIGKGKLSFRVSPRSATVMYGHTIPIIPGKANLYVGGLARIERTRGHETALEKKIKAQGTKIASKLPAKLVAVGSKTGFESSGGTTFHLQRPKVRQPQLRTNKRIGPQPQRRMPITGDRTGIPQVRSPNRKPRTRKLPATGSAPRPTRAVTAAKGKKVITR